MNPIIGLDVSKGESQIQVFLDKGKSYRKSFSIKHDIKGLRSGGLTQNLSIALFTDYHTIVIEANRHLCVKQTPIQLIKQSCLERSITYEGVKEAVRHKAGFKRKTPIPIDPHLNIYLFPTHATDHFDCCRISYHHVLRIKKNHTNHANNPSSTILFKNGESLHLPVSPYILKKQMKRTLECVDGYLGLQNKSAVL